MDNNMKSCYYCKHRFMGKEYNSVCGLRDKAILMSNTCDSWEVSESMKYEYAEDRLSGKGISVQWNIDHNLAGGDIEYLSIDD